MNAIKKIGSLLLMGLLCQLFWSCTEEYKDSSNESAVQLLSDTSAMEIQNILRAFKDRDSTERIFQKFQDPPEASSRNGKFIHDLDIRFARNEFFDYKKHRNISLYHRSYNGGLTGVTWRVKPGDSLYINLFNKLEAKTHRQKVVCNEDSNVCYDFKYDSVSGTWDKIEQMHHHGDSINIIDSANFNNTNLHVHGLHVSPKGHSDNVFVNLKPGQDFQNRIHIPENHAQGSFWYHGHVHGSTAIQVSSGMAGALIIEGGLDEQDQIKEMKERIFMLQQMPYIIEDGQAVIKYVSDTTSSLNTFGNRTWKPGKWRTTINGQVLPVVNMQKSEVQRWRFFHAGIRESVNLKLVSVPKNNQLNREKLHVIAEDGIAYGRLDKADSMLLHPGYRADLLVKAPREPDTLLLIDDVSKELGEITEITGDKVPITAAYESLKVLAIVIVKKGDKPVATKLPTSDNLAKYAPYKSLEEKGITTIDDETMTFDIDVKSEPERFLIDGKTYHPDSLPRTLKLNQIQDWQLSSDLGNHPFHIHVNHFQVIARQYRKKIPVKNGERKWKWGPWGDEVPVKNPIWKDTYMVNGEERTVVRTAYKDFTGQFVIHCHILLHEDMGMMQRVEIIDESTNQSQASVLRNSVTGERLAVCR